jgi:hypothetical protein
MGLPHGLILSIRIIFNMKCREAYLILTIRTYTTRKILTFYFLIYSFIHSYRKTATNSDPFSYRSINFVFRFQQLFMKAKVFVYKRVLESELWRIPYSLLKE